MTEAPPLVGFAPRCGANRVELVGGELLPVHLPELVDARDYRFTDSKILNAFRPLTGASSISYQERAEDIDLPRVQIAASCVGHSIRESAMLVAAIAGAPIESVSPLWPYTNARLIGEVDLPRAPGAPRLVDWGCGLRYAIKGIRDQGFVLESAWPEVPDAINVVPPLDTYQAGEGATIEAFYRISDGPTASTEIVEALRRGYCPIMCMIVDAAFEQIGDGVYDQPGGKQLGGHAMTIVGYSAILDAFLVLNHWGRSFGNHGYVWISAAFMNRGTYDKWVLQVAPKV